MWASFTGNIQSVTKTFSILHTEFHKRKISLTSLQSLMKAHPECANEKDIHGDIPLHTAIRTDQSVEILCELLRVVPESINSYDRNGFLPVFIACTECKPFEVIRCLVDHFPGSLMLRRYDGALPIHILCGSMNSISDLRIAIMHIAKRCPESLRVQKGGGFLPIHLLCQYRYNALEVLELFIELYPEGLLVENSLGLLPIHIACIRQLPCNAIEYMALKCPQSLSVVSNEGHLPIDYLYLNGYNEYYSRIARNLIPPTSDILKNTSTINIVRDRSGGRGTIYRILLNHINQAHLNPEHINNFKILNWNGRAPIICSLIKMNNENNNCIVFQDIRCYIFRRIITEIIKSHDSQQSYKCCIDCQSFVLLSTVLSFI